MRTVAGECGDESEAAACFKGARRLGVHVVVARSARSGRLLSESASSYDLSAARLSRMLREVMFASGVSYCVFSVAATYSWVIGPN